MNKDEFLKRLESLGFNRIEQERLSILAHIINTAYKNKFNARTIKAINYNKIDRLNDMRFDLDDFINFNEDILKYAFFEDYYDIYIDDISYIRLDLKDEVKKIVINGNDCQLVSKMFLSDILKIMESRFNLTAFNKGYFEKQKKIYLTSLIYNYALAIMEREAKNSLDLTRAGMFKNAYFEILGRINSLLDQKKHR